MSTTNTSITTASAGTLLTTEAVADKAGITRPAVWYRAKALNIQPKMVGGIALWSPGMANRIVAYRRRSRQ